MLWSRNHSLFSPQVLSERPNRSLLLQFLLLEIIEARRAVETGNWSNLLTVHPCFFPYDWGRASGCLNRAREHSLLLGCSFPKHKTLVKRFEKALTKQILVLSKKKAPRMQMDLCLRATYTALEPLLELCGENENLLFFLLKNRREIDALMQPGHLCTFLLKIHPNGLETLGEKMCDQYHQRGFFSQIPEFKLLLTELLHA